MKPYLSGVLGLWIAIAASAERPNVVFFLIDDLSYFGMTPYGAVQVASNQGDFEPVDLKMPNIERLAQSGVRCDQAYTYPLCEPTRVALMSGMHNGRNLVQTRALHASQITFGDVLQRAGYATGMYGKWKQSRGTREIPGRRYISEFGWDDYCCFDVVKEGRRFIDPNLVTNGEVRDYEGVNPATGRRDYGPDIVNGAALQFIEDHQDRPFFLYYPMMLVHDEHTPTPDTRPKKLYDEYEPDVKQQEWLIPGDERKYFPDMLAYTDKLIGKVLNKLEQLGLRENTLVVVMGDNGGKECFRYYMADGSFRDGQKGHNRDGGEHVGLFFSQPGTVPSAQHYAGMVDVVDIYPTLMDACGVEIPNADKIDGISAWPQLCGKKKTPARDVIYHWYNQKRKMEDLSDVVRYAFNADFKRYAPHDVYAAGRFFDLRTDIKEEAGTRGRKISWQNYYYSGLELDQLTPEQQSAFDELGHVLEAKRDVAVERIQVIKGEMPFRVGDKRQIKCRIHPANATRNNVIWESSDPSIASVDKFGELTAHKAGDVEIRVFSWEDSYPRAYNAPNTFLRDSIQDAITISVGR